jgi:hypothetical protein
MESWVETKHVIFCSSFNATILLLNISKEVFKVQGAWHSPNTSWSSVRLSALNSFLGLRSGILHLYFTWIFDFHLNLIYFKNVDECHDGGNKCGRNSTCNDTIGSYTCACDEGYQKNNNDSCKGR